MPGGEVFRVVTGDDVDVLGSTFFLRSSSSLLLLSILLFCCCGVVVFLFFFLFPRSPGKRLVMSSSSSSSSNKRDSRTWPFSLGLLLKFSFSPFLLGVLLKLIVSFLMELSIELLLPGDRQSTFLSHLGLLREAGLERIHTNKPWKCFERKKLLIVAAADAQWCTFLHSPNDKCIFSLFLTRASSWREYELVDCKPSVAGLSLQDQSEVRRGVHANLSGGPLGPGSVEVSGRHLPELKKNINVVEKTSGEPLLYRGLVVFRVARFELLIVYVVVLPVGKVLSVDPEAGGLSGTEGSEPKEKGLHLSKSRPTFIWK